jgi:hypothetical protein
MRFPYQPKAVRRFFPTFLFDELSIYLAEPEIPFVFTNDNATQNATVYLKISVSTDSTATSTSKPGVGNDATTVIDPATVIDATTVIDTTTGIDAASESTSRPTNDPSAISGTPVLPINEDDLELSATEKFLRDADHAMERIQPPTDGVSATAGAVMAVSAAVDNVANIYTTWEKAVGSIKQVMDVVDKIAEVSVRSFLPARV